MARGVQTTVASTVGVGLSFVVGAYLGVSVWTFAPALFVGLAGARISWIRDEGVAIATTAIFILGSGFTQQQPLLLDRLIEVGVGVGIGIAVNLLFIPPLRDQQAARYVDSINGRMGGCPGRHGRRARHRLASGEFRPREQTSEPPLPAGGGGGAQADDGPGHCGS